MSETPQDSPARYVPWKCRLCGIRAQALRGTDIVCSQCGRVTTAPIWETPRPWDENAMPTDEQFSDWLGRCTDWERLEVVKAMRKTQETAIICAQDNHADRIRELERMRIEIDFKIDEPDVCRVYRDGRLFFIGRAGL